MADYTIDWDRLKLVGGDLSVRAIVHTGQQTRTWVQTRMYGDIETGWLTSNEEYPQSDPPPGFEAADSHIRSVVEVIQGQIRDAAEKVVSKARVQLAGH